MNPLKKPLANCPNDEVCIEDEVERRRSTDRGVWVRWAVGGLLSVLSIASGWTLGRINTHGEQIVKHESQIITLEKTDTEIKLGERDKIQEERRWRQRIEEKIDRLMERRR